MDMASLMRHIEGLLAIAGEPVSLARLENVFAEEGRVKRSDLLEAINRLDESLAERGVMLQKAAGGWRLQARPETATFARRLFESRPPRYSRAVMETLALIAWRQPITRSEIEQVRGVSVSTQIIRTLESREWIRVAGHRDVPGRPALYATTHEFLADFNLDSLNDLPALAELAPLENEDSDQLPLEGDAPMAETATAPTENQDSQDERPTHH